MKSFGFFVVASVTMLFTAARQDEHILRSVQIKNDSEDLFKEIKSLDQETQDVNITGVLKKEKSALYGQWSKWSPCRSCRKVRRKKCVSRKCHGSVLYEKRPCKISRCKRKHRRKNSMSVLKEINPRRLEVEVSWYSRWSEWSSCSKQCTTKRERWCRKSGQCPRDREVELAYCYKEKTACERWIQSILQRRSQPRYYDYAAYSSYNKKIKMRNPKKCGAPYKPSNMVKIMGGRIAKRTKWPWHVALLNYKREVFCGGTLISPNWVLTAAHCLRNILYVRLNEYDISTMDGSEIEYYIRYKYQHPAYNSDIVDNDIALLRLPKSVQLPYACLPTTEALPPGKNCTIVGWGKRTPSDTKGSKLLRQAQLPVVQKALCVRSYRNYIITNNMFCAGYKNGGIDTCSGDSGGGFMCLPDGKKAGWTVQGITSFGESCGKKGKYGIYTDVRNYLPWLKRIMKRI